MSGPLFTGFLLCFSLNCVIGAQNTYLFRQGVRNEYVYTLACFCIISDFVLILLGVYGMSLIVNQFYIDLFLTLSAVCLIFYAILRLRNVLKIRYNIDKENYLAKSLKKSLITMSVFTLLNPHVYLDTVILIGSASLQFNAYNKITYIIGATAASIVFFFGVAILSKLLSTFSHSIILLKIIDIGTAIILVMISVIMLKATSFI